MTYSNNLFNCLINKTVMQKCYKEQCYKKQCKANNNTVKSQ